MYSPWILTKMLFNAANLGEKASMAKHIFMFFDNLCCKTCFSEEKRLEQKKKKNQEASDDAS